MNQPAFDPATAAETQFVAFGTHFGLRSSSMELLQAACAVLPLGWQPACGAVEHWYELLAVEGALQLRFDGQVITAAAPMQRMLHEFARHAELAAAEHAKDYLFVHAGVVGWQGQAILIPGRSFSGKTTLVKALIEAGASYYSDEYALLDRSGMVHPYPRPLAVRAHAGHAAQQLSAAALGGTTGTCPLPVGIILITTYQAGAHWQPHVDTPGQALLALMDNTVAARGNPAHSMPILKQAVTHALILTGTRGAAEPLVPDLSTRIVAHATGA